ncbi:MAG TPA: chaperone modulator CbpM [Burkholderiaceae bacterium]
MKEVVTTLIHGSIVDDDTEMTLVELCQACSVHEDDVRVWVSEGVLHPSAEPGEPMRFRGAALRRARVAVRLTRDLEVNTAGVALALELLDEIAALRAQLVRAGA